MSGHIQVPEHVEKRAAFYGVHARTLYNWAKMTPPAPVMDAAAMVDWVRTVKISPKCQEAIDRISDRIHGKTGGSDDPDWKEFSEAAIKSANDDPKAALADLAKARDFAAFKLEKANKQNDRQSIKFYSDLLVKFEGAIHDAQLRARKLGMDEGELLPRHEIERIFFALGFWLMRATDQHLDTLSASIAKRTSDLSAEDVRRVLEPELLSARFLVPFARSASIQSGLSLPQWIVDKLKTVTGDYLADGEKLFAVLTKPKE